MRFICEVERLAHPQARLIPVLLWDIFFDTELPDEFIRLMQSQDPAYLMAQSTAWRSSRFAVRQRLWLAIALSREVFDRAFLRDIANVLGFPPQEIFLLSIALGDIELFQMSLDRLDKVSPQIADQNFFSRLLNRLKAFVTRDPLQTMIAAYNFEAFRFAAGSHLEIFNRLVDLVAPGRLQAMIAAENFGAFRYAALNGQLETINRLVELVVPGQLQTMIAAKNFAVFHYAARSGYLEIINRLVALVAPEQLRVMVAAQNFEAFRKAVFNKHLGIVNYLLHFPVVLAYAEAHVNEYHPLVTSFVTAELISFHQRQLIFEREYPRDHPHGVFDLENGDEARKCFYMVRNLIRRNDPMLFDDLRFLLMIPSMRALAHSAVTPGYPNELIRLALTIGNRGVIAILLDIPEVRRVAEAADFYCETQGGLDLAAEVHDRESSMRALTTAEQRRFASVLARYEPQLRAQGGVDPVINAVRNLLKRRYATNPARVKNNKGQEINLPFRWEAFQDLGLQEDVYQRALVAYYKHKDHTAYRYLSKPNPWLHARAIYVYADSSNPMERWSSFESYQFLISLLYLAAIDEEVPPTDGHTLETRINHFLSVLADIGRAHNWDRRRRVIRDGKVLRNTQGAIITEEYDDEEGDSPSCYSGTKRRLFLAVLGHPLLVVLTQKMLQQELRDFVRGHFERLITEDNCEQLLQAWKSYLASFDAKDAAPLCALDIQPEKQREFFVAMRQKYGSQFDSEFEPYVRRQFTLREGEGISSHEQDICHAIKLDGLISLETLLSPPQVCPSQMGLFATGLIAPDSQVTDESFYSRMTNTP